LADVSPSLAGLFEQAFRGAPETRPAARQWVEELESLARQCKACRVDSAHVHFKDVKECPWCRIEDEGGPAFFVLGGSASRILPDRLDHLDDKLRELELPVFPDLSPHQLRIPRLIEPKRLYKAPRPTAADAASWLLTGGAGLCLAGTWSAWALAVGALTAACGAAWLIGGGDARARRSRVRELAAALRDRQRQLAQRASELAATHRGRALAFARSVDLLQQEHQSYNRASTQIHNVLAIYRSLQKSRYLASASIQRNVRHIPGMNLSLAAALASYGVESAYDVDPIRLLGLSMISDEQRLELEAWRAKLERQFVYEPDPALRLSEHRAVDSRSIDRFKASVARRILMAAAQLQSAANAGRALLAQDLEAFERQADGVREAANELRKFQTQRRPWERALNRSKSVIAAAAVAATVLGGALWWLNR
jgi:DNA-binding helix-hairpin-helix protein with protein kinase domain